MHPGPQLLFPAALLPMLLLLLLHPGPLPVAGKPCCFTYRGWVNPCSNVTCPDNSQCQPALNVRNYKCTCPADCWDVGDSDDSGPVCGDDGISYESLCHLQRASCHAAVMVRPLFKGHCDPCAESRIRCGAEQRCVIDEQRQPRCLCGEPCLPSQRTGPVCASNGETYNDECHMARESCLEASNLTKIATGACPSDLQCFGRCPHPYMECRIDPTTLTPSCTCPGPCPRVYNPVCGSNNITYESLCHLHRAACLGGLPPASLLPMHRGDCGVTGACRRARHRLCRRPGGVCRAGIAQRVDTVPSYGLHHRRVTYELSITCERPVCLWMNDASAPPAEQRLLQAIVAAVGGESNLQVCGSDGVIYKSQCHLRQQAFDNGTEISLAERRSCNDCRGVTCAFHGFCRLGLQTGRPECHCHSSCVWKHDESICGSDGRTYISSCELRRAACQTQRDIREVPRDVCRKARGESQEYDARRRRIRHYRHRHRRV